MNKLRYVMNLKVRFLITAAQLGTLSMVNKSLVVPTTITTIGRKVVHHRKCFIVGYVLAVQATCNES